MWVLYYFLCLESGDLESKYQRFHRGSHQLESRVIRDDISRVWEVLEPHIEPGITLALLFQVSTTEPFETRSGPEKASSHFTIRLHFPLACLFFALYLQMRRFIIQSSGLHQPLSE